MTGVVRKPHPDLAALIADELEVRHGSTATWGEHIAERVAEWLTSPETIERAEDGTAGSHPDDYVREALAAAVWEPSVRDLMTARFVIDGTREVGG